jgi:hypothetical protein
MESFAATIRMFRKETILPKVKRFLNTEPVTNTSKAAKVVAEQYLPTFGGCVA